MQSSWSRNTTSVISTGLKACFCVLLFTVYCSLFTAPPVYAAPHITGLKPEPFPSPVGKRLSERIRASFFAPTMANKTSGVVNVLFLRVDFQPDTDSLTTGDGTWTDTRYACDADLGPGIPSPVATDPLCTANPYDYWVNRAKQKFIDYYNEVSYGSFSPDGIQVTISPSVYRLPKTIYLNYGEGEYNNNTVLVNLISESIQAADAGIDFSLYDAVLIIHAGPGEETDRNDDTPYDIWSLYYSFTPIATNDSVSIGEAIIMPQTGTQDGGTVDPLGIYVHEFGHWLGLPDLYDTSGNYAWDGIGKWGLMGAGIYLKGQDGISGSSPSHPDAWCKSYLGWVTPQTISTDNVLVTFNPVETNKQIIKVPASNTTSFQYFLLENRQQTGFDYGLPGSGLVAWLIDESVIIAQISNNTVNNNPQHPGVALMEADGDNALKKYYDPDYGSSGDPFPGSLNKTLFSPYTYPSSTPYSGSAWLYLKDISIAASDVNATIGFAPTAPTNLSYTLNSSTKLTWTANADPDFAKYKVYKKGSFLAESTQNQYTDSTSLSGDTYTVSAVDVNGYESARSASVTVAFSSGSSNFPGIDSGGGCFIATAAYGSYEATYVRILREFRDSYLLTNGPGKAFVKFYYKFSPPMADFIRESEMLRAVVRVMLLPLIGIAAILLKTSLVQKILIIGVAGLLVYKRERERPPTPSLVKRGCRQTGN